MNKDKQQEMETVEFGAGPPVVEVKPEVVEKPDEDSVAAQLRQLGAALIATAEDEVGSKETLAKIDRLLGSLQIKDYPALADSPVVQTLLNMLGTDNLKPGQTVSRGTLAEREREWTWRDLFDLIRSGEMPVKTFIPNETVTLTWNGIQMMVMANEECQVPGCFYDIYRERQRAIKEAQKHEAYLLGFSDMPPHPDWQTPEGAVVRAWSTQGRRYGRPGGTLDTGLIQMGEDEGQGAEGA